MSLQRCFIEFHEYLRTATVFLQFNDVVDPEDSLNIKILDDGIILTNNGKKIIIDLYKYVRINPISMCNLYMEGHLINFRLQLKCMGNELLSGPKDFKYTEPIIAIESEQYTALSCSFCSEVLIYNQYYRRFCAYPEGNMEYTDFFCHDSLSSQKSFLPKSDEIFYGFDYVIIRNSEKLEESLSTYHDQVSCKKCTQVIGIKMYGDMKAIKFWADCIKFKQPLKKKRCFYEPFTCSKTIMLFKKMLHDRKNSHIIPELQTDIQKFVIEAVYAFLDRRFLLITINTKQMIMLDTVNVTDKIQHLRKKKQNFNIKHMERRGCYRMRYAFEEKAYFAHKFPPLTASWELDGSVNHIEVSEHFFKEICKTLAISASILPEKYCKDSDDFHICYLDF